MQPERWDDALCYTCPSCASHLIKCAEVERFLVKHDGPRKFTQLMERARAAPLSPRSLVCPDCQTRTFRLLPAGLIEVDVCCTCISLFLDKGEARIYLRQARLKETGGKVVETTVTSADAIAAMFEIIASLLP
jgi:Zn-finger nucleic acid-binding protein